MDISQLMRGLIGSPRAAEGQVLELKVGDVVKGTVVKVLPNDQALININGSVISAKLETPLSKGQVTMLQVQPESTQGIVVLKPLGSSLVQITNESLAQILKGFGLKNQALERQLIQSMHLAGLTLNKANVTQLASMLSQRPDRVPAGEWIQSGVVTMQRGMPISAQSISAIHQVLYGQPIDKLIQALRAQITQQLQTQPNLNSVAGTGAGLVSGFGSGSESGSLSGPVPGSVSSFATSAASTPVQQILLQLEHGLQQIITTGRMDVSGLTANNQGVANSQPSTAMSGQVMAGAGIHGQGQNNAELGGNTAANVLAGQGNNSPALSAQGGHAETIQQAAANSAVMYSNMEVQLPTSAQSAPTSGQINTSGQATLQTQQASTQVAQGAESQRPLPADPTLPAAALHTASAHIEARHPAEEGRLPLASVQVANVASPDANMPAQQPSNNWISSMLKLLGVEHEQQASRVSERPELLNQRVYVDSAMPLQERMMGEGIRAAQATPWDSVKSLLLQLSQVSEQLPQGLRDNAQQLLQQITGQQLFMSADRGSHFSHITLFIPLHDEHGTQTASINIQSRKGNNGSIDPENCRLVFDLNMANLGDTIIEVVVTNKIVSLQVHNNHPFIAQLLEEGRNLITDALQQLGYHLSSVTHTPFPESDNDAEAAVQNQQTSNFAIRASLYSNMPYRGLDVRV